MSKIRTILLLGALLAGCNYGTVANPQTDKPADILPSPSVAEPVGSLLGPPAPTRKPTAAPTVTPEPTPTPTPSPTPEPTPQVIKIKGTQTHGNTKKFALAGDYTVTVTGKAKSNKVSGIQLGGGNLIIQLVGDLTFDPIVNEIVKGGQTYTFSTFEYDLDPGSYYMTILIPEGSWAVTFVPIIQ